MEPISSLKWIVTVGDDTECHRAQAWGYFINIVDDGEEIVWSIIDKKSRTLLYTNVYPGDPNDDIQYQFEVCEDISTLKAWYFAKKEIRSVDSIRKHRQKEYA